MNKEVDMKCPKCKQRIRGGNKRKVRGVWFHKRCPASSEPVIRKVG